MMHSLAPLKKLYPYVRPDIRWLYFSLAMALPLSLLRVGPIPLVKFLVDEVLVHQRASSLLWVPLGVIALYTLNLAVRFLHYFSIRIVVVRTNQRVKIQLYQHLFTLSNDDFSHQKSGALLSRVTADPAQLDNGIAAANVLLREPITFAALFGYALYTNWKLTLLTLITVPFLAFVFIKAGNYIKSRISMFQEQNGESYAFIQESISGIKILHHFQAENLFIEKFKTLSENISKTLLKVSKMEEIMSPTVEWVTSFAIALILYQGGKAVLNHEMTSGELIAFFTAFGMMINPIRQIADINSKLHTASAAMERISDFLSWESKIKDVPHAIKKTTLDSSIQFNQVSFHYLENASSESLTPSVLQQIQFEIKKGQTVALVGQSGSGKSTLAQLLTRSYDVTEGEILVDQIPLKNLAQESWRACVSVVSQDVFLFHDTIYNNILMGKPSATYEEVVEAAKKAYALEFIQKTPKGFQTVVGDRGMKLSGGERQRLSIARAFLKNSDLLILDEATSNLDNESEKAVQASLDALTNNKTTLVIAHRLSTIKDADLILVLKQGEVLERGTYQELMALQGEFFKMSQFGF